MADLMSQAWVVVAIIVALAVLAIFHCAAAAIRNHHHVHDLRVRVNELRIGQLKRLQNRSSEPEEEAQTHKLPQQQAQPQRKAA